MLSSAAQAAQVAASAVPALPIAKGNWKLNAVVRLIHHTLGVSQQVMETPLPPGAVPATIVGLHRDRSDVRVLQLQLDSEHRQRCMFKPGQWVDFYIPGVKAVGGYSMISTPRTLQSSGLIELAVKRSKHAAAAWVHAQAQLGSQVHLKVGGSFFLQPERLQHPLLFVAGGIGVTPLCSMLGHIMESFGQDLDSMPSVVFLYSARTARDFVLLPRLLMYQQLAPQRVHLWLHVTRDPSHRGISLPPAINFSEDASSNMVQSNGSCMSDTDAQAMQSHNHQQDDSAGSDPIQHHTGSDRTCASTSQPCHSSGQAVDNLAPTCTWHHSRVDKETLAQALVLTGTACNAFVCGPPDMADTVWAQLTGLGVCKQSVHCEKWW